MTNFSQRWISLLTLLIASNYIQRCAGWMTFCRPGIDKLHTRHHRNFRSSSDSDTAETVTESSSSPIITGVTLKVAFDQNWGVAEMADVISERFTCDKSLDMVHRLRRDSDAVLVGRGTVERDDCSLTVRRGVTPAKQPLRVILDPRLSLVLKEINEGAQYKILTDGLPTVVYHCVPDVDLESLTLSESVTLIQMNAAEPLEGSETRPGRYVSPESVLESLKVKFGAYHVMVEGGPTTALNFLTAKLVDRAIIVKAPIKFQKPFQSGMDGDVLKESGLELLASESSGVDTIEYWVRAGESWPTDPVGNWP